MIKIIAGIGSLILIITAGFHFTGFGDVRAASAGIEDDFMQHAILTNWLILSVHLFFVAVMAFGASFYRSRACAAIMIGFGLWILADAAIILTHVGYFIAVPMLGVAGLCLLVAGFLLRRDLMKIA